MHPPARGARTTAPDLALDTLTYNSGLVPVALDNRTHFFLLVCALDGRLWVAVAMVLSRFLDPSYP